MSKNILVVITLLYKLTAYIYIRVKINCQKYSKRIIIPTYIYIHI